MGLIFLHALWDLETVLLVTDSNAAILSGSEIAFRSPLLVWVSTLVLFMVPAYVWLTYPRVKARLGG